MEEKEFLTEHPSLKGEVIFSDGYGNGVNNKKGYIEYVEIETIHKTQLDKKIVKMAIESHVPAGINKEELKEELELENV